MSSKQLISSTYLVCTQALGIVLLVCLLAGSLFPNLTKSIDSHWATCEHQEPPDSEKKEKESKDEREESKESEELYLDLESKTNWREESRLVSQEFHFALLAGCDEVLTPPPEYM